MSDEHDSGVERDVEAETMYFVATYLCDRAYGGPEEGGWWYDYGDLVTDATLLTEHGLALPTCLANAPNAYKLSNEQNALLKTTLNVDRRPKYSVLSEGVYESHVMEGSLPSHFPITKPHYE
jgi:hypothetical protein